MNPTLTHTLAAEHIRDLHDAVDRPLGAAARASKPRRVALGTRAPAGVRLAALLALLTALGGGLTFG